MQQLPNFILLAGKMYSSLKKIIYFFNILHTQVCTHIPSHLLLLCLCIPKHKYTSCRTPSHYDSLNDSVKCQNVLADVMKHTPFPYMPCPECAPAAFAHHSCLSTLTHKESSHLNGFTFTCLGTHITFFGTCSPFICCHTLKCVCIVSVPRTLC